MRAYFLVPVTVGFVLGCSGADADVLPAPVEPPVAAVAVLPAAIPVVPTNPTAFPTDPPVATDEIGFVAKELRPDGPSTTDVDDGGTLYGQIYPIATNRKLRGVECAAEQSVHVSTTGQWSCALASPWTSQGVTFAAGEIVTFWLASANAAALPLAADAPVVVQNVPCTALVEFDVAGNLHQCELGAAHSFAGGTELPLGTPLTFDAKGNLASATLLVAATVRGVAYKELTELTFSEAGDVTSAKESAE